MLRLKLKEIASTKAISMSKLSRLSDVSYDTIQQIYHTPYKDVNLSTLEKLADALTVNVCDLFEKVKEVSEEEIQPKKKLK
ncbi:MAG: helix-turn-helix transcriptional regulator [Chloroflexi bacterium]|nr:helix-turn-helix transcriptional regulator [Ktedonobacteraceae bacterium]MBV9022015.1 helix-turn-helix transcriptional regulator [Ktedonobacteraceae bacterium]MBV9708693.1 helix-turn-helix transcriptional regulator [Chloroflexota bacterium]